MKIITVKHSRFREHLANHSSSPAGKQTASEEALGIKSTEYLDKSSKPNYQGNGQDIYGGEMLGNDVQHCSDLPEIADVDFDMEDLDCLYTDQYQKIVDYTGELIEFQIGRESATGHHRVPENGVFGITKLLVLLNAALACFIRQPHLRARSETIHLSLNEIARQVLHQYGALYPENYEWWNRIGKIDLDQFNGYFVRLTEPAGFEWELITKPQPTSSTEITRPDHMDDYLFSWSLFVVCVNYLIVLWDDLPENEADAFWKIVEHMTPRLLHTFNICMDFMETNPHLVFAIQEEELLLNEAFEQFAVTYNYACPMEYVLTPKHLKRYDMEKNSGRWDARRLYISIKKRWVKTEGPQAPNQSFAGLELFIICHELIFDGVELFLELMRNESGRESLDEDPRELPDRMEIEISRIFLLMDKAMDLIVSFQLLPHMSKRGLSLNSEAHRLFIAISKQSRRDAWREVGRRFQGIDYDIYAGRLADEVYKVLEAAAAVSGLPKLPASQLFWRQRKVMLGIPEKGKQAAKMRDDRLRTQNSTNKEHALCCTDCRDRAQSKLKRPSDTVGNISKPGTSDDKAMIAKKNKSEETSIFSVTDGPTAPGNKASAQTGKSRRVRTKQHKAATSDQSNASNESQRHIRSRKGSPSSTTMIKPDSDFNSSRKNTKHTSNRDEITGSFHNKDEMAQDSQVERKGSLQEGESTLDSELQQHLQHVVQKQNSLDSSQLFELAKVLGGIATKQAVHYQKLEGNEEDAAQSWARVQEMCYIASFNETWEKYMGRELSANDREACEQCARL
jgi:hypothetical protein